MWLEFSFVSEINETFKALQFSAVWLCLAQGYCWVKTSLCDLMRLNAAVPIFTLVPSTLTPWAFLRLMHAIYENCSYIWCGLVDDTSLILTLPTFEQNIQSYTAWEHLVFSFLPSSLFLPLVCRTAGVNHLKHFKRSISNQWVTL